jgi:integration host factor subunit beta
VVSLIAVKQMRNDVVTKALIVEELRKESVGVSVEALESAVDAFFDSVAEALICGDRVELRGFGSWGVRKREERMVRNPQTNARIEIGPRGSLYFRASKELLRALNCQVEES